MPYDPGTLKAIRGDPVVFLKNQNIDWNNPKTHAMILETRISIT